MFERERKTSELQRVSGAQTPMQRCIRECVLQDTEHSIQSCLSPPAVNTVNSRGGEERGGGRGEKEGENGDGEGGAEGEEEKEKRMIWRRAGGGKKEEEK